MLWTIFLLLNGLLILVLVRSTRSRRRNEPPLDKGFVPWLGHALAFSNDAAKFLARMKEKHGDIFTVRVAGRYVTVLLDANSFDAVLNDSTSFDANNTKNQTLKKVFDLQLPSVQPASQRRWMEEHFEGLKLFNLCHSMGTELQNLLLQRDQKACSPSEWREEGLFSLCYSLLFRAGYCALFEGKDNGAAVYKEFRKFDGLLCKLARCSLKREERKTAHSSRERLWELLSLNSPSRESNTWQSDYQRFLQEQGVDVEMQKRALLLQLWTTQCNAGPAAFWLLGFLLTHPEAMEAVKSEIRGVSLWGSTRQHPSVQRLEAHSTPVLDSVLQETLRLTAAVMIGREVVKDTTLLTADGRQYRLRQGDKVCLFPFLSPQADPEIHPDPQDFKYDRFLNEDGTRRDAFYKGGRRLRYYSMPWGAGRNVCVGKEFAERTIKQFVFLLLTCLDLELCDPEDKLPPVNAGRYGFGMLQPDGDLQVRYRLKGTQNEI